MTDWYIEQVFAARTWKLRKEVFSATGQLSEVMLDGDFEAAHFAAYSGDEVVGVLTLLCSEGDYEILYFAVHPDFRKQGAGSALLRYTLQFVKIVEGRSLFVRATSEYYHFWTQNGFLLMKESGKPDRFIYNLKEGNISQ
ncbi:GNAT family N-acetyltransferase [Sphingobacterium sp. ML3W]|uniref:GNAT family N-acetyltransferase n=1 Tax=Sphingobacterium sp. ML3W TaxID=1538644 RepID=UPI00249C5772|nr:GNAT family N-acetyltransferase [Sphingobacterium sp. ML3W]WFA81715.1 GNAT family N-acetyltransferase [Sphingobacterium sp. ML3W]